ncbi:hypothetical protein [Streptomyces sp. NBC_01497]|uniref:hypothetical protein n=1 Tax=Streptomyces sp. NBC_01497 TaxID=2903885 RepID=UPI002E30BAAA|nr:hypothetical protein [Streptomyces sp. NBC_01497]
MTEHSRHDGAPADAATNLTEMWSGRARNRVQWLLAACGAGCIALGVGLVVNANWTSGVAALLIAIIGCFAAGLLVLFGTLAFVHVGVRIDEECLEVRCGHMGVPRRRIPLAQVVDADFAPRVTPHQWGGWGYRWLPEKGTAVVVRRGEGLVLRMRDGRDFTVTVDDAQSAVRILRARCRGGRAAA